MMKSCMKLYRVVLPYAVFGVLVDNEIIVHCAPIAYWARGMPIGKLAAWVSKKNGDMREML